MNIKAWRQCDEIRTRIAVEKEKLVTLIKVMSDSILKREGSGHFIGMDGCEWTLGMDTQDEHIVAWSDGIYSDLIDLTVDELLEIAGYLYRENYVTFKH